MTDATRPQRSLTVFLLPSGDMGREAMTVAKAWAEEGLLQRAVWVTADDISTSHHGATQARGVLLDQGQAADLDVLTVLSRSRLSLLTFIVLQIPESGQQGNGHDRTAVESLAAAIEHARPEALMAGGDDRPVDVVRLNVIAAPTGTNRIMYSAFTFPFFNANLVASPEDRRAPDQMDQFVRAGNNLIMWAVAQAVTAGGAWSGMPEGPWRFQRRSGDDSSLAQGQFATPVRGFARVVTSAPTARRALALAMEEIREQPTNILMVQHVVPTAEPGPFIDAAVDAFDLVDGGRIAYETPDAEPDPERQKVPLGKALADFLRFSRTELAGLPRFLSRRSKAKWSLRANKALSGKDGNEIITVGGESPDLLEFTLAFERQSREAERTLGNIEASLPPAAPGLWRTLRSTTFALLDASPMPEPIPTPIVADQRVVMPATTMVAPPLDAWKPNLEHGPTGIPAEALPVHPTAPWEAGLVATQLQEELGEAEATYREREGRLHQAREDLLQWEIRSAHDAVAAESTTDPDIPSNCPECSTELDEDGECPSCEWVLVAAPDPTPDESPDETTARLTLAVDSAQSDLHAAEHKLTVTRKHHESFTSWLANRDQAFLWRLSRKVAERTVQAQQDAASFREEAVSVPDVDHQEPTRARNQFARRLLSLGSLALIAALLLWRFGSALSDFLSIPTWTPWTLLVVIVVVAFVLILLSNYRRRSRFVAALRTLRHRQQDAQRRCVEATYAHNKLKGIYEQLAEWTEILSHAVHDPLRPDASWFSGLPSAELAATLPACVDLAVPDPDDRSGTRKLQQMALSSIAGEGWRARTFNLLLDLSVAGQAVRGGDADTSIVDMDAPATPNGARGALLRKLRSGELQEEAARDVLRAKAADIYAERNTLMTHTVRPVNSEYAAESTDLLDVDPALTMLRPTWGDFLGGVIAGRTQFGTALWSDQGSVDIELRRRIRTFLFLPPGMEDDLADTDHYPIAAAAADRNRGIEVAVRCDLGQPSESITLRLFSSDDLVENDGRMAPIDPAENTQGVPRTQLDPTDFN